jgi:hypothetical protein
MFLQDAHTDSDAIRAVKTILEGMDSLSLEEMGAVKLMNRTDTKYLLNEQTLLRLAEGWSDLFYVQEIAGRRVASYKTLYFDTEDAVTYTIHHNRQLHRQKLRQREYVDSGVCFCEIKNKLNTGRTKKKRIEIPQSQWGGIYEYPETEAFVKERFWVTDKPMSPRLQNQFRRITLVNRAKTERITIDYDVKFKNLKSPNEADASGLVIVEVKQDGNQSSDFKRLLRDARVQPKGLSKYCFGMILTDNQIKYNRFKEKVRYVNRILGRTLECRV